MRVSPVAYARETLEEVLAEAKRSAEVTHDHAEGIRGAQATAAAVFLARRGDIELGELGEHLNCAQCGSADVEVDTISPRPRQIA